MKFPPPITGRENHSKWPPVCRFFSCLNTSLEGARVSSTRLAARTGRSEVEEQCDVFVGAGRQSLQVDLRVDVEVSRVAVVQDQWNDRHLSACSNTTNSLKIVTGLNDTINLFFKLQFLLLFKNHFMFCTSTYCYVLLQLEMHVRLICAIKFYSFTHLLTYLSAFW